MPVFYARQSNQGLEPGRRIWMNGRTFDEEERLSVVRILKVARITTA
jgi:hypothetical protein